MVTTASPSVPAEMLAGLTLANDWTVMSRAGHAPTATGGNFSVGYFVKKPSGQEGFLKALDFVSRLQHSTDVARDLQWMTEAFNFERDILLACKNMSRIVTAIEEGDVSIPGIMPPFGRVQYLIFELAEGDVRHQLGTMARLDTAWALRSLHHQAVGLLQMHKGGIAHQDLKPSNVLTFEKGKSSKLGDLGRATSQTRGAPHDRISVAGDPTYAPPEMLYRAPPADWVTRRIGCDVFHLGSMVMFFFGKVAMMPLLLSHLDPAHRPDQWGGSYADVLPHVRAAFEKCVASLQVALIGTMEKGAAADITEIVRSLCDPDPADRGFPRKHPSRTTPLALERLVSRLDVLATEAAFKIKRRR